MMAYKDKLIRTDKYHIRFFQIGEKTKGGDAILIRLFNEADEEVIILIDGGYKTTTGSAIVEYIKKNCTTNRIERIYNTHPDKDHIGGIVSILESDLTVGTIYMNRPWKDSGFTKEFFKDKRITKDSLIERIRDAFTYADEVEELAVKKNVKIEKCFSDDTIFKSGIEILGPTNSLYKSKLLASDKTPNCIFEEYNQPFVRKEVEDEDYDASKTIEWFDEEVTSPINETSLVIAFHLGSMHFLFTGDAGKEALEEAFDKYEELHGKGCLAELTHVQLPHHGSRKNFSPGLIQRLGNPEYIISCPPEGFKEGHPSRRLINKILELKPKAKIYQTQDINFNFYKGIKINCTAQSPATLSPKMDGKTK
jgi:beta-lactamase superfamily II metal-dependent hydrolase